MDVSQDGKVNEIIHFLYALYNTKPKQATTLKKKVKAVFMNDAEKSIRQAQKLTRRISGDIRPEGSLSLNLMGATSFKYLVQRLVTSLGNIIGIGGVGASIAALAPIVNQCISSFCQEWNTLILVHEGEFLDKYGVLHPAKLSFDREAMLPLVLNQIHGMKRIPQDLQIFQDEHVCRFLGASVAFNNAVTTATTFFQNRGRNAFAQIRRR